MEEEWSFLVGTSFSTCPLPGQAFSVVNVEGMESFPCPWGLYFIHHNKYPPREITSFQLSLIMTVADSTSPPRHSASHGLPKGTSQTSTFLPG